MWGQNFNFQILKLVMTDQTANVLYLQRKVQGRSRNHSDRAQAIIITYSECVCSHSYPACNAHTPYCHLWPVRHYNIFPHYLINWKFFEKKNYWLPNVIFYFLCKFVWKISYFEKNSVRYYHKCTQVMSSDFSKTLISLTRFRQIYKYQISWKSVQWEPSFSMRKDRQTDRQTWRSQ
jgi:hypothetical protein